MKSAALVLFSVLTQTAVGLVLVSVLLPGGPLTAAVQLAPALVGAALIVSLGHLGAPGGAVRALANLRSSWLSREVLLTSLFAAAALVYGFGVSTRVMGLLTGGLGLAALFAQGMVYQLPTRAEWRSGASLWGLAASALLLGALTTALAVDLPGRSALRFLGGLTLAAAALVLLALALWSHHLVRLGRAAVLGDTWFWVRLVAGVMLPALAGVGLLLGMEPDLLTTGGALAGAVTGEALGRSLYFRAGWEQIPQF